MMENGGEWILAGRTIIGVYFLVEAIQNAVSFRGTKARLAELGVPVPAVSLALALAVMVVAALALIIDFHAELAALALIAFTIVVTLVFHRFWAKEDPIRGRARVSFMYNFSILGGLCLIIGGLGGV